MSNEKLASFVCRLFFAGAFVLLGLAVLEKAANIFGYTLTWIRIDPSRLIEFAIVLLVFVVTLLLREIRDAVRKA
jgi:hypothetical protein